MKTQLHCLQRSVVVTSSVFMLFAVIQRMVRSLSYAKNDVAVSVLWYVRTCLSARCACLCILNTRYNIQESRIHLTDNKIKAISRQTYYSLS